MDREACVCDHGLERSDLCAEIIIIIIITARKMHTRRSNRCKPPMSHKIQLGQYPLCFFFL